MSLFLEVSDERGAVVVPIDADRITIGGPGCDVAVEGAREPWAEVRLREGRASILRLPGAPALRVGFAEAEEALLAPGLEGSIGPTRFRIREEPSAPTAPSPVPGGEAALVSLAAVAVIARLAEPSTVRKWREEIERRGGGHDGLAAAREVLAGVPGGEGNRDLLPAAVRLQRDALAAGGAARRQAALEAKRAAAFAVSHLVIFLFYALVLLVGLLVARRLLGFDLYRLAGY